MKSTKNLIKENFVTEIKHISKSKLPTKWGNFEIHVFLENKTNKEHIVMKMGDFVDGKQVLARIHSECLTGDALFSQRCDCGAQLELALEKISKERRGILLYLRQEGRGIGIANKIRAYNLQDKGADTVEANLNLGFEDDLRNYNICQPLLRYFEIRSLKLMTNNPQKIESLLNLNFSVERQEHVVNINDHNINYLKTKSQKLGHLFDIPPNKCNKNHSKN